MDNLTSNDLDRKEISNNDGCIQETLKQEVPTKSTLGKHLDEKESRNNRNKWLYEEYHNGTPVCKIIAMSRVKSKSEGWDEIIHRTEIYRHIKKYATENDLKVVPRRPKKNKSQQIAV
jgi:hypothetical protein